MSQETLVRITGEDFCAGAVFALDPPVCVRAADKISLVCLNRGLRQVEALCRSKGWKFEIVPDEKAPNGSPIPSVSLVAKRLSIKLVCNPSDETVADLCKQSRHLAAKWIRRPSGDDIYYWPADNTQHVEVAQALMLERFDKGIAVVDD